MMKKISILAAAALVAVAGTAFAGTDTFRAVNTYDGQVLAGQNGRTLYTYDKDANHLSVCYGSCAAKWPPYLANPSAQPFSKYSFVVRKDGQRQWALNGEPLYFRANDKKPGDVTGDGVSNLWQVARPA
ncbi:UNVERIFIED_ORG: putative lipoprotein with Yx(FWY)xxD motif [Martelella mediterranea]